MSAILRMLISQALRDPAGDDGVDAGGGGAENGEDTSSSLDNPISDRTEEPNYGALIDEYEERTPAKPAAGGKTTEGQQPGGPPAGKQPPATPPAKAAVPPVVAPPAAPAAGTPPAQQSQQAPAAVPPQQQAAQQTPPAQQSQQTPPAQQSAADQPLTFEAHRDKTLTALEPLFQMTAEEAEQLRVEPEKIMPKLAARVAFESMVMTFQSLQTQLPQLIGATMSNHQTQIESDKQFKARWPELYADEHKELVLNSINAYRAANPKATMEQLIEGAGAFAMIALGRGYTPQQQQQQQAAPAAVPGAPPRPAGAGATSAPIPSPRRGAQPSQGDDFADIWQSEKDGTLSF